jgi:opacity protein-like surface antigen
MKKTFLLLMALTGFAIAVQAQGIADNALGIRLGDNDGFGTEINYQRALNESNRLEFGLGWNGGNNVDAFKLTGLYQWVFNLDGNFNWYVGAGGGVGQVNYDNKINDNPDDETFFFAAGDIGIEYDFDIPLLISLDFRPEIGFGNVNNDVDFDIALGLRYQF